MPNFRARSAGGAETDQGLPTRRPTRRQSPRRRNGWSITTTWTIVRAIWRLID